MNRTKWIESLKPKDKVIRVRSDGAMELVTLIEIEDFCNETLAKIISTKQDNLFARWINIDRLIEPTEYILSEIELKKKIDRLKNCMWQNIDDVKINAVYDILFGGGTGIGNQIN